MTAIATKTLNKPPRTMLEVFKSLPEGTLVQLIKNQLVMSPSPSFTHQKVLASLFNKMYVQVEKDKSGILLVAPFDVYLDRKNAFQPDIIFIAKENISRIKDNGLYGPPDLAIEILSPSTGKYDLEDKMDVYAANGVKEYWIIEPHEKLATGYWLAEDEYHEFESQNGVLASKLLKKKFKF
jgi:Uma2 family endonuclease